MPSDDDEELRRLHEKLNDNFNSIRNENEKKKNNSKFSNKSEGFKSRYEPETIDMIENKNDDGKVVYEVHNHNTYNTYNVNNNVDVNEKNERKTPFWKTALKTGGILALGSAIIVVGIPILLVKTISFVKENWKIIAGLLIVSAVLTSTNKGCSCSLVDNEVKKSKVSHYDTEISKNAITLIERRNPKKSKCLNILYPPKKA